MEFVECIGFQHHTVSLLLIGNKCSFNIFQAKDRGGLCKDTSRDKVDLHYFRWCYGENLFFRADGSVDLEPIHFWYPWLSEHLRAPPILESLKFKPAESHSLEALIRAYAPGKIELASATHKNVIILRQLLAVCLDNRCYYKFLKCSHHPLQVQAASICKFLR